MQNARKKCPVYLTEFSKVLKTTLVNAYIQINDAYKTGKLASPTPKTDKRELIKKLLFIWKDRNILDTQLIDSISLQLESIKVEGNPQSNKSTQKEISKVKKKSKFLIIAFI